jgi:hypothetical protein
MKKVNKIRNATPLTVDGINFKSKLEVYCYNKLKEAGLDFEYEQNKFGVVPKFIFPNKAVELIKKKGEKTFDEAYPLVRAITYTPDFVNLKQGWIIECKGYANESFPIRWKLFKKYIHDNGLDYDLYVPRNKKQVEETIKLICQNLEN